MARPSAVPMIVVCPACEAIVGFEIDMIRRDSKALILPYVPFGSHPVIDALAEWILQGEDSPIGTVEQIVLQREQANRSREAVLVRLAVAVINTLSPSHIPTRVFSRVSGSARWMATALGSFQSTELEQAVDVLRQR